MGNELLTPGVKPKIGLMARITQNNENVPATRSITIQQAMVESTSFIAIYVYPIIPFVMGKMFPTQKVATIEEIMQAFQKGKYEKLQSYAEEYEKLFEMGSQRVENALYSGARDASHSLKCAAQACYAYAYNKDAEHYVQWTVSNAVDALRRGFKKPQEETKQFFRGVQDALTGHVPTIKHADILPRELFQ